MSEKYIDLAERVTDEIGGYQTEHSVTLNWLDRLAAEHPDQVPGRTITTRKAAELYNETPFSAFVEGLRSQGITVLDPKPTNADILADYVRQINRTAMSAEECGKWLDRAGVKAPGGDDDH